MLNNLRIIAQGNIRDFYPEDLDNATKGFRGPHAKDCTRWLNKQDIIIAEAQPQLRTIRWSSVCPDTNKHFSTTHQWQLPYLQFLFFADKLGLAANKEPYQYGHPFYLAPLPNVYDDGLVCQGFHETLDQALMKFYSSRFSSPMGWDSCNRLKRASNAFSSKPLTDTEFADKWQEESRSDDPLKMFDFDWADMGRLQEYSPKMWELPMSGLGSIGMFLGRVATDALTYDGWYAPTRNQHLMQS